MHRRRQADVTTSTTPHSCCCCCCCCCCLFFFVCFKSSSWFFIDTASPLPIPCTILLLLFYSGNFYRSWITDGINSSSSSSSSSSILRSGGGAGDIVQASGPSLYQCLSMYISLSLCVCVCVCVCVCGHDNDDKRLCYVCTYLTAFIKPILTSNFIKYVEKWTKICIKNMSTCSSRKILSWS